MDFGRVLGEFWEAKILDFRIFFDVFSKHFSNIILEGQKIEKSGPKRERTDDVGTGRRNGWSPGREIKRGVQSLFQISFRERSQK